MAHPVSPRLRIHIADAAMAEGIEVKRDGTYVCMEGPQFSTYAESMTYKQLGYSVIGMTNMPEAKLAREAEICYATVAMVTDFDCWHPDHDAVTVQDIIAVLTANAEKAKTLVARLAQGFPARARAVPDRLRPRARHRADHRARGARSGIAEEARCGGGKGAGSIAMNDRRSRPTSRATNGAPGVLTRMRVSAANGGDAALPVRAVVRAGSRRAEPSARRRGGAARARRHG